MTMTYTAQAVNGAAVEHEAQGLQERLKVLAGELAQNQQRQKALTSLPEPASARHDATRNRRLIARRIATRHEHFMPRSLSHSQFEALDEPGPDEAPVTVSIEPQPREVAAQILSTLAMAEGVRTL